MIDEVHMIGEDSGRGANLESFITKIKYMNRYDFEPPTNDLLIIINILLIIIHVLYDPFINDLKHH